MNPIKDDPRYREFHQQLFPEDLFSAIKESGIKKSLLDEEVTKTYKAKLQHLIETDKPHLNPDLSLRSLADQLGLHANQLSWLLNHAFNKNFNEFINYYRIESFKELARVPANANLTILAIAYDCGFNSKTVSHTYFKKETGVTPKQFL